ncbi:hypothetical protein AB0M20_30740 [Actinoplanes sp. NPDC051633]
MAAALNPDSEYPRDEVDYPSATTPDDPFGDPDPYPTGDDDPAKR